MKEITPDIIVDLRYCPPDEEGVPKALPDRQRAPCCLERDVPASVAICMVLINGAPIVAGECRRIGLSIIPDEGITALRKARDFYLRFGSIVLAEATIAEPAGK